MSFNNPNPPPAYGAAKTTAASTGFSFGQKPASSGLNFGGAAPAASSGFGFGAPTAGATSQPVVPSGFSFGGTSTASTAVAPTVNPAGGFSFGGAPTAATKPTGTTGFGFGAAPATTQPVAPVAGGFSFGAKPNTTATSAVKPAASGFSFGSTPSTVASAGTNTTGTFLLGGAKTTQAIGFSLTAPATQASATSLGAAITKPAFIGFTATTGLSFATPTAASSTAASSSNFKLLSSTTTTASVSSLATATSTTSSTLKQVSYKTLEETIDKWLYDLNEQEKSFLNQASQVNTWDKQLIENGEKISEVHSEVERLKAEQSRLDRELDFILSQQEELEELLTPIEAQVNTHPMVSHTQHADIERERTYGLAENIDSQLKHMMQSLNEIIDHINSSNTNPTNQNDESMAQIAKILNAHMDSLQWVDQNTNKLQQRVKEVSQVMDTQRKEQERSFHLSYE